MKRILLSALAAGVLAGVVAALVIPRTREDASAAPQSGRAAVAASTISPLGRRPAPDVAAPRPLAKAYRTFRSSGSRILTRVADPQGEPGWAVRTFRGSIGGRDRGACAQLGRIYRGRFGWIDEHNVFRPARHVPGGAPMQCAAERSKAFPADMAASETTMYGTRADGSLAPRRIVLWGRTAVGPVHVRLAGRRARERRTTADGAYLTFLTEAETGQSVVIDATGRRHDIDPNPGDPRFRRARRRLARLIGSVPPRLRGATGLRTITAPARVTTRTPDPSGGPALGLSAAPGNDGRPCLGGTGEVVGQRVGRVQPRLGIFTAYRDPFHVCDPNLQPGGLSRRHPYRLTTSAAATPPDRVGGDLTARRTQPGRVVLTGYTRADVRSLRIKSPRDVRTIIPAPRSHAFIVVYDGRFVTGEFVITATFADGSTVVDRLPVGMM